MDILDDCSCPDCEARRERLKQGVDVKWITSADRFPNVVLKASKGDLSLRVETSSMTDLEDFLAGICLILDERGT